jgi:hypothetical protein
MCPMLEDAGSGCNTVLPGKRPTGGQGRVLCAVRHERKSKVGSLATAGQRNYGTHGRAGRPSSQPAWPGTSVYQRLFGPNNTR